MLHHYGKRVRILHWCIDQIMSNALAQMDLTASQSRVMGYLAYRKEPPCARDVEEEFQLTHPTVSGILSRLERMHQVILSNEEQIVRGFTEEEKLQFASLLERAILNMGGSPCQKHKEEDNK